jgi:hypothetical protein
MLPEDLAPWVDKLVVLSLKNGESTIAHVLYVDRRRCDLFIDVISSNRSYPDSERRAFTIPFGRILSVRSAPPGVSPRRPLPSLDSCYADYGALDRIFLFLPIILLFVLSIVLFAAFLTDLSWGTPIASLTIYTELMILMTFSAQRGQQRYLFKCRVVRSLIPELLKRHLGFSATLFVLETAALDLRPHFSVWWLTANGRNIPPFYLGLFIFLAALGMTQAITNRSLLQRAHLEHLPA